MVLQSASTLADLTEQRVIPADYLYCLILLFLCLVLDRVFYTLGHHLGKVGRQRHASCHAFQFAMQGSEMQCRPELRVCMA